MGPGRPRSRQREARGEGQAGPAAPRARIAEGRTDQADDDEGHRGEHGGRVRPEGGGELDHDSGGPQQEQRPHERRPVTGAGRAGRPERAAITGTRTARAGHQAAAVDMTTARARHSAIRGPTAGPAGRSGGPAAARPRRGHHPPEDAQRPPDHAATTPHDHAVGQHDQPEVALASPPTRPGARAGAGGGGRRPRTRRPRSGPPGPWPR